jgi:hypothetical protein
MGRLGDGPSTADPALTPATIDACASTGPSPMRRLTRWEYNNTIADLLGDTSAPATKFVPEAQQFGFDNNAAGATLNLLVVGQFETAAEEIADRAVKDLPALLGCDPAVKGEDTCADAFIKTFTRKAFRRPLATDELQRYATFYTQSKTTYGFSTAVGLVLRAIFQSPNFLYRLELGMPAPGTPEAVPLTPFETATRLSYLLWGSMPDEVLLTAAESGKLGTPDEVAAQAKRLLDDPRGARSVKNFYVQWASLGGLSSLDRSGTDYTPKVAELLRTETEMFVDEVIRHGDGKWATLLGAPYSYMNAELAAYYGVKGPSGTEFEQVPLDPVRYAGLMTQGSLMAHLAHPGQPSPVLRGTFVRDQLLCTPMPPPPDDVDTTLPAVDPKATARQQLEQKTGVAPCSGCHALINPPGFAFENFDEIGRFRATDHGLPIDATGTLIGTDVDGQFQDHTSLLEMLGKSEQVRGCVVKQWFRYAYGRGETKIDSCSTDQLKKVFTESGGDVRKLLMGLTQTSAFLYRGKDGGVK